jgi:hypothetical protein
MYAGVLIGARSSHSESVFLKKGFRYSMVPVVARTVGTVRTLRSFAFDVAVGYRSVSYPKSNKVSRASRHIKLLEILSKRRPRPKAQEQERRSHLAAPHLYLPSERAFSLHFTSTLYLGRLCSARIEESNPTLHLASPGLAIDVHPASPRCFASLSLFLCL